MHFASINWVYGSFINLYLSPSVRGTSRLNCSDKNMKNDKIKIFNRKNFIHLKFKIIKGKLINNNTKRTIIIIILLIYLFKGNRKLLFL